MFCNHCGTQNADSAPFCSSCGKPTSMDATVAPPPPPPLSPTPSVSPAAPVAAATQQTDGKATASLILGILSLTMFWILAGIPAIILGHMSRSDIRKSMGRLKGEGMALVGLIMGYISVAMLPVVLIIAAIAIPNLLRARTAANEAAAVGSLRTIEGSTRSYYSMFGQLPQRLEDMGAPQPGNSADQSHADLIDNALAGGLKSGYRFQYEVNSDGSFFVRAVPVRVGNTGNRSFCTDQTAIIRVAQGGAECTATSEVLE